MAPLNAAELAAFFPAFVGRDLSKEDFETVAARVTEVRVTGFLVDQEFATVEDDLHRAPGIGTALVTSTTTDTVYVAQVHGRAGSGYQVAVQVYREDGVEAAPISFKMILTRTEDGTARLRPEAPWKKNG